MVIFIFWPTDDGRLSTEDRFFGRDVHQPLVSTRVSPVAPAAAEAKKAENECACGKTSEKCESNRPKLIGNEDTTKESSLPRTTTLFRVKQLLKDDVCGSGKVYVMVLAPSTRTLFWPLYF